MNTKYWPLVVLTMVIALVLIANTIINRYQYVGLSELEHYALFKRDFIRQGNLEKVPGKQNVVVIGASGLACGFLPKTFDELSELTHTWNLSLASHMGLKHSYMLTDFIRNNYVPDVVIWNPGVPSKHHFTLGGGLFESLHLFSHTQEPFFLIDGIFPGLDKKRLADVAKAQFNLASNESGALLEDMLNERGTYYWGWPGRPAIYKTLSKDPGWIAPDWLPDEFRPVVDPKGAYMNEIYTFLDIAKSYDIKVLVVPFPSGIKMYKPYETFPEYYQKMTEYYDQVSVISSWNNLTFDGPHLANSGHLNYEGAKRFSQRVFDDFSQRYLTPEQTSQ